MHGKDGKHKIQENDYLGEKSKEWNGRQAVLSDLSSFQSPDFCFFLLNFRSGLMNDKYKCINNYIKESRPCSAKSWLWTKGLWWGFPCSSVGKDLQCRRHRFSSWVGKIPWRRKWQPTLIFLPGESHGERSLAGCSLCGCKSWTRLSN